jgi:hypothetical protein
MNTPEQQEFLDALAVLYKLCDKPPTILLHPGDFAEFPCTILQNADYYIPADVGTPDKTTLLGVSVEVVSGFKHRAQEEAKAEHAKKTLQDLGRMLQEL